MTMIRHALGAALIVALSSAATAQVAPGRYDAFSCTELSDGGARVEPGRIFFHESACDLTNPTPVRDMGGAVLYDLQCSGEGSTWTDRVLLMQHHDGGLVVLRDNFVATYQRCD